MKEEKVLSDILIQQFRNFNILISFHTRNKVYNERLDLVIQPTSTKTVRS